MTAPENIGLCPFCAAPAAHPLEVDSDGWALVCGTCGTIGPIAPDVASAISRWNMRPASAERAVAKGGSGR